MPTYHVENFGCRATQADGAALERQFESRGLALAPSSQADLVILNTCTVTNSADQDARAAIQQATRRYAKRQLTWFRKEPGVHWLTGFGDDANVQRDALAWLREQ